MLVHLFKVSAVIESLLAKPGGFTGGFRVDFWWIFRWISGGFTGGFRVDSLVDFGWITGGLLVDPRT